MRQHCLAFGKVALDASAGDVQLVGVAEQCFPLSGANNYQLAVPQNIFAMFAGGVGLTRARINTGSLRARGFPQIYPLNATVKPPTPVALMTNEDFPIALQKEEDFRIDVTNGAANDVSVIAFITPDQFNRNVLTKDLRMIRFTATVTAIAQGWSSAGIIVLQDLLEGGVYDIYGMALQGPNIIAGRLIVQGEFYRPGCLGQALTTAVPGDIFMGQTGKWCSFNTYSPPQIETFESAAGASSVAGWLLCGKSMAQTNTDNR
jgi:hypothetical protein